MLIILPGPFPLVNGCGYLSGWAEPAGVGGEWGELGRAEPGKDGCVLSDTVVLSPVRALREEAARTGLGARVEGGGRGPALWSRAEPSESRQMRLLLVKRGSVLPLYLRLVTDHLRLFTLYEQVG